MKNALHRKSVITRIDPDLINFLDNVFIPGSRYTNRSDIINDLLKQLQDSHTPIVSTQKPLPDSIKQKLHG